MAHLLPYLPFLIVLAVLAVIVFLPLVKAKVQALAAYRTKQESLAAGAALDAVTAVLSTLVARAETEVRDLKNPLKPGAWDPKVDGPKVLRRVVTDFWELGNASWEKFRKLERLDVESSTKLLESIAQQQLLLLRATPPLAPGPAAAPVTVAGVQTPAELAGLVAAILRDPATAPLPARPLRVSLRAEEVSLDRPTHAPPEPIDPVEEVEAAFFDPTKTARGSSPVRAETVRIVPQKPDQAGSARVGALVVMAGAVVLAALLSSRC